MSSAYNDYILFIQSLLMAIDSLHAAIDKSKGETLTQNRPVTDPLVEQVNVFVVSGFL